MSFSCNIKSKNKLNTMKKLEYKVPELLKDIVTSVGKNIRDKAIKLERGNNANGINVELVKISEIEAISKVHTSAENMPWAMFEHFGTGDFRELPAIGKTKHFIETGGSEWFIPVNKVEKALNYPIITINDIDFYVAHGAKANHFMTDAEFLTREENKTIIRNKIDKLIKEVSK